MRLLICACSVVGLFHGAASANPAPSALIGAWTDQAGCTPNVNRMIFGANTLTMIRGKDRRLSVQIETSGTLDDRLEIRVTKLPPGRQAGGSNGPKVGDVLVVRREGDELHLLAEGSGGTTREITGAPTMRRCAS